MGSAIARSLIQSGHRVVGYDVRASRRRVLRAAPIYAAAVKMGASSRDTAAVCAVLEKMAHVRRR
jgi:3-hydroxyisobutyrate dehydrogenase-like beta-hydroxyacid dehydrogenase